MRFYITLILTFVTGLLQAQQTISVEKKSYYDSDGNLHWNQEKPVYIRVSDTPDGEGLVLKTSKSETVPQPMYLDTEGVNYIRSRYAVDPVTRKITYPKEEVLYEIYADGTAPESRIALEGAKKYEINGETYFGKNLVGNISSKDSRSGVAITYSSVNKGNYQENTNEIHFPTNGRQTLSFYAIDNVGNAEAPKSTSFIVDLDPPQTIYNINGLSEDNILGTASKIYLNREDKSSGVMKTLYRFDKEDFKTYLGENIPFQYLEDGNHTFEYYSIDQVGNEEVVGSLSFYFDKSAPIVAADILGDRFILDEKVYFSGRTKMKLTAVDNKSGVKDILFSLNNKGFKSYKEPFYLPSVSGLHTIRYYSIDNMSNQNKVNGNAQYEKYKHNVRKVYVDLTGPTLKHSFEGQKYTLKDTTYISPRTQIQLEGYDDESGLQKLTYSINGTIDEIDFTESISIQKNGFHSVEAFGYDNVNNRNINKFSFIVDGTPPEILPNFSIKPIGIKDGLPVYPKFAILYLAAKDDIIGVSKIMYSINGKDRKLYERPISGFTKGKKYEIQTYSFDNLNNESSKTVLFFIE